MPARDLAEDAGRGYIERIDTVQALAIYEFAGRLEYTADPVARAVERLAADPEAVLVINQSQTQRAWAELKKRLWGQETRDATLEGGRATGK